MPDKINTTASPSGTALDTTVGRTTPPPMLELPLLTTGMIGRKRRLQVILGMRPVVFAPEEFTLEEAPIVAVYRNKIIARSGDGRFFRRLCDRPEPLDFSYTNERLDPLLDALGFDPLRRKLLSQYGKDRFHVPMRPNTPPGAVRLSNLDELSIRERSDKLINQQMEAFETLLASLAVIGDGLYVCCDEPHFIVRNFGSGYIDVHLSTSLGESLSRAFGRPILGIYPVTKSSLIQATFEHLAKPYGGKIFTSEVTVYEPTLFSESFPVENVALMARELLEWLPQALRGPAGRTIMKLRAAGGEGIVLLDEIQKALADFEADRTIRDPLVRYVGDLLELPDDAPLWLLLGPGANLNRTVNFVREQLEAMEITLDVHPHLEPSHLPPGAA